MTAADRAVDKEDLGFNDLMGLWNDRGVYPLQSIEQQGERHGSPGTVDSSSLLIIWDGKSPFWLSWDWRATMAVPLSQHGSRRFIQSADIHRAEYLTPTFRMNGSSNGEQRRGLGLAEWKFNRLRLAIWDNIRLTFTTGFFKSNLHPQNKPLLAHLNIALFTPHMHNWTLRHMQTDGPLYLNVSRVSEHHRGLSRMEKNKFYSYHSFLF